MPELLTPEKLREFDQQFEKLPSLESIELADRAVDPSKVISELLKFHADLIIYSFPSIVADDLPKKPREHDPVAIDILLQFHLYKLLQTIRCCAGIDSVAGLQISETQAVVLGEDTVELLANEEVPANISILTLRELQALVNGKLQVLE